MNTRLARAAPLRVGTRASPLALWQARHFLVVVGGFCPLRRGDVFFEECALSTAGDRILDRRLAETAGKFLFAKEIHEALLDGRVDFAVHSLKDLETELPPGIVLAASSLRRQAQVLQARPELRAVSAAMCRPACAASRRASATPRCSPWSG